MGLSIFLACQYFGSKLIKLVTSRLGPHVSDRSRRFYRLAMQPQHEAGYFTVDRRGEVPSVDIPIALFSIFINSFVVF